MKKVCVLSYFGLGDCIRFSPIWRSVEETFGPCEFHFTSPVQPLKHLFDVSQINILPMKFSKFYDVVLNFSTTVLPECDEDLKIWRGYINDHETSHHHLSEDYIRFNKLFSNLDRESNEVITLCKRYRLLGSSVIRFSNIFGLNPFSFDYLYKVTDEERGKIKHYLSSMKKNICFVPNASLKLRSLNKEKVLEIYEMIKHENVIVIGKEEEFDYLDCKKVYGDIREAGAFLSLCDYVITVDSYFSYVAYATKTPVIVLFSYCPEFVVPPVIEGKIITLEHPTEGCNSISKEEIYDAIKTISNI
jgi:Glycosyltransferase family 9 (heptosyltransferase)